MLNEGYLNVPYQGWMVGWMVVKDQKPHIANKNCEWFFYKFSFLKVYQIRAANFVINFNEDEMACIKATIADNHDLSLKISSCSENPNPRTCIQDLPELKKCFIPAYKVASLFQQRFVTLFFQSILCFHDLSTHQTYCFFGPHTFTMYPIQRTVSCTCKNWWY